MNSAELLADATLTLSSWVAPDAGQEDLRRSYLKHLATHPDGMFRCCLPAHLTASAIVLDPPVRRVLLALHAKAKRWLQLGGHCEPGDQTLRDVAAREAAEESGIPNLTLLPEPVRLDRHQVRCRSGMAEHLDVHLDVQFAAVAPADALLKVSEESLGLRWFDVDALPDDADASLRRLVTSALAALC